MTEAEYLARTDPHDIVWDLRGRIPERKLRLFGVACCRRIYHLLADERSRATIECVEQYADGLTSPDVLNKVLKEATSVPVIHGSPADQRHAATASYHLAGQPRDLERVATWAADAPAWKDVPSKGYYQAEMDEDVVEAEKIVQLVLLRDILGNPFRPVSIDPAWLTPTVVALAQAAYEERELPSGHLDLSHLAVLADALEEAGSTNTDILAHLRLSGPHVRGCWVIDRLLCKE